MAKTLNARFTTYVGTSTQWSASEVVLLKGEIGYESDTGKFKFGNGVDKYSNLSYSVPTKLSELTDDSTHRLLTDTEKAIYSGKQDKLTFDTAPTSGSANPVTSGGVKEAIDEVNESIKAITGGGVVSGVKGSAESTYRVGNVNITPANIGLGNVNNTSDANKPVSTAQQAALDLKANKTEIPDVSQFITKAVNDLTYYYTKTQVDGKVSDLESKISAIPKFAISVVDTLPTSGISETTIYLKKTSTTETGNLYTEYIYVNNTWESLGTQTLDLSDYATKTYVSGQIANFVTEAQVNTLISTALASYVKSASLATIATSGKLSDATQDSTHRVVTDTEKSTWNGKQNKLTFDTTPTASSTNPVTSGGIKTALDKKADTSAIVKVSAGLTDSADLVRYSDTIVINGGEL